MYLALALAVEEMKGKPEDIKLALNYAADVAQRTHNPNDLVKVADALFLKGYYDRVGALLDEGASKVPHRAEPLVMSINLAQKTKDPKRMADSDRPAALAGLARQRRVLPPRVAQAGRGAGRQAPRGEPRRRGRRPAGQAARGRGSRRLHPPALGRRRRLRPGRAGAARRDRPVLHAPNRLRRLDHQERIRQPPRGDLRLPARVRRRLHGPDRARSTPTPRSRPPG